MTAKPSIYTPFRLLVFIFITTCLSGNIYSQTDNTPPSTTPQLNLGLTQSLGGTYYQDQTGVNIAINGLYYEGNVDKTSYILGANDLITIEIQSSQNTILRGLLINATGDVIIPNLGFIKLKGLTVNEAEAILTKQLSEEYVSPTVSITVELPKPINVHIAGAIPFPGKFTLPGLARVDLAVFQAVTKVNTPISSQRISYMPTYTSQLLEHTDYSLRNIEIVHEDGSTSNADLISYFRTGDLKNNPVLSDGDRIILKRISRNTPTVSISGAVKYGYTLEHKKGETIADLLKIAGGFEENADSTKLFLFRATNGTVAKKEVSPAAWDTTQLLPNDRIIVPELLHFQQSATALVKGEVQFPGRYPITPGVTSVAELVLMSGGLTEHALPGAGYLIRGRSQENEIPNKFNTEMMARTSDQYAQGLEYLEQETSLSQNRVYINLDSPDEMENIFLYNGDYLFIPRDEKTVFVFGQVNNPGYFPFIESNKATVQDYIQRAGGFALSANKDRVFIIKAGNSTWFKPEDTTLESGDRIFVDRNPVEDLNALRSYEIQKQQLKNQRIQLVMTGITTVTGIITTLVAIGVIKR